jgi:hypothetical protein
MRGSSDNFGRIARAAFSVMKRRREQRRRDADSLSPAFFVEPEHQLCSVDPQAPCWDAQ